MKISGETKLFLGIGLATILLIVGAIVIFSRQEQAAQNTPTFSREELLTPTTAVKGNASASAYLVAFSDFQCPACKAFAPIIDQLNDQYGESLVIGYRHYPLPQHQFAESSARAAQAAHQQGKFWQMHDELFSNQEKLSDQVIRQAAKTIQLNEELFNQAFASSEVKQQVDNDRIAGNKFGVNATPTFFLNGKKLTLRSPQDLTQAIETAMQQ